jgi:hypothetical protein
MNGGCRGTTPPFGVGTKRQILTTTAVVIESYLQKPADESGLTNPLERLALVTI